MSFVLYDMQYAHSTIQNSSNYYHHHKQKTYRGIGDVLRCFLFDIKSGKQCIPVGFALGLDSSLETNVSQAKTARGCPIPSRNRNCQYMQYAVANVNNFLLSFDERSAPPPPLPENRDVAHRPCALD